MTIAKNEIFVKESPKVVVEGELHTYGVLYKNTIDSVGDMWIYKNASSDESSGMLSGTMQKNGRMLTLKTISFVAGSGGNYYIATWSAVVNGQTLYRKCEFICKTKKSRT